MFEVIFIRDRAHGTTTTELTDPAYDSPDCGPDTRLRSAAGWRRLKDEWPSCVNAHFEHTPLEEINQGETIGRLKIICTYDTKQFNSFESGLIMVNGSLDRHNGEFGIFSIDFANCAENWRTHEDILPPILRPTREHVLH